MENFLITFIKSLWELLNAMSVYIVFGLLFAGILKYLIPQDFIKKTLGKDKVSTIFKSALVGIPMPLCSCSVIPFISALKKDGANKSSIQTFLISTPITGADSIIATWGTFGWVFTIYRLISSVIISIIAGLLTLIFDKEEKKQANPSFFKPSGFSQAKPNTFMSIKKDIPKIQVDNRPFYKKVYDYAFVTLLQDIAKPFLIGIVIAAFISTLLPNSLPSFLENSHILSYLVIIALSLPIYVCATASIPIAISLLIAGFSPGAAFIFLTAGPASNMVTILVVKKILGLKSLIIYLCSIFIGSFIFGYGLDFFFEDNIMNVIKNMSEHESTSGIEILSTIVLLILCFKLIFLKSKDTCCNS